MVGRTVNVGETGSKLQRTASSAVDTPVAGTCLSPVATEGSWGQHYYVQAAFRAVLILLLTPATAQKRTFNISVTHFLLVRKTIQYRTASPET
jgi:hypothetical protein